MTKKNLWTGLVCLGWGTGVAISIINHFFPFWSFSLWLKVLYLGVGILLCGLVIYWLLRWKLYSVLGRELYRLGGISLILGLSVILLADYWAHIVPMPLRQMFVLEVSGQRDAKSNGGEVWLYEIKDAWGGKVPFYNLKKEGEWQEVDGVLVARGNQPSKLSFAFTLNPGGNLELLFLSHPNGGIAEISAGKRQETINLYSSDKGNTLVTIEANNSLVDWRIRSVLYIADAMACALSLLLLLALISKPTEIQWVVSRLSSLMQIKTPLAILRLSVLMQTGRFKKLADASVIIVFICFSFVYTIGRTGDSFSRMVTLTGDAANIASFAAALDHPELFAKDPLLSDPGNFAFYFTIHVPIIRLLNHVFGNYGTAFVSLLFPVLFIQMMGFYYLGNALYRNRFWAFLLAIATAIFVLLPLGEVWGFHMDPLPRIAFQAFLPFLLGTAIKRGGQVEFWPWVMGCAGLLVYVHPVSAPAWGVAILLGLWFSAPSIAPMRKFKMAVMAGFVFLLVIAPFAANYLTAFSHSQAKNYDQVMKIFSYRFSPEFLDLPLALRTFYQQVMNSSWINRGLWIWAGAGFGLATYLQRKNLVQNRRPYILASWWGGLLLISVVVPLVEHAALKALHRTPLELDLIRGLRYTIPLLWMTSFWALSEIYNALRQRESGTPRLGAILGTLLVVIAGVGMVFVWANQNQFVAQTNIPSTYACWTQGMFVCPRPEDAAKADFLDAIRVLTPPGSSLFYSDLAVRYYALRSIIYTNKDGGALGYANHDALLKWYEQNREIVAISNYLNSLPNKPFALKPYLEFARKYDADYFVLQPIDDMFNEVNPLELKLIYRNSYGSLYEIIR